MPEFLPFRGVHYDLSRNDLADVSAPPYDVIDATDRERLIARDTNNIVRIDLPLEDDGPNRYVDAATTFEAWRNAGVLVRDEQPSFYLYQMETIDAAGVAAHTLGVLGALRLSRPGEGDILPHEFTTPKAKSDRLDLLRATRVNLSAIWGLSLSTGLTELCRTTADPDARWSDDEGTRHTLWTIHDPSVCEAISACVGASPIVIADGHHRYETSLAYRDERAAASDDPTGAEHALVYVVELTEDELEVRPIHRLITGVESQTLIDHVADYFTVTNAVPVDDSITDKMLEHNALVVVDTSGIGTFLVPKPNMFDGVDDLDSARLAHALRDCAGIEVRYQHGVDNIVNGLQQKDADCGVLLRPATVAQIQANAHSGNKMPPKTTFFHPKPRTGQVFRITD